MSPSPSIKFKQLIGDYRIQDGELISKFKFELQDDIDAKISHRTSDGALGLTLEHNKWELGYDTATRRATGKYKHKLGDNSHVKVTQSVVDNNWSNVPNPELEVEFRAIDQSDYKDNVELKYDFGSRVGLATYTAKIRGAHKVSVAADTKTKEEGAVFSWRMNVKDNRLVKQIGFNYNKRRGATLKYKGKPTDNTKLVIASQLEARVVDAELTWKPDQLDNTSIVLGTAMLVPSNGDVKFENTIIGFKIDV